MSTSDDKATYRAALEEAMIDLSNDPRVIFMGQAVDHPGTAMSGTLPHGDNLLELPVAEDMQMGMAIGMSLAGFVPVCIFPRWNFLLLAMSQLVLHLDKLPAYSDFKPKVIIRTAVATPDPLNPGPQHLGDYSHPVNMMLQRVRVRVLITPENVRDAYTRALHVPGSWLLIEHASRYT